MRAPISLHLCQYLLPILLVITILSGYEVVPCGLALHVPNHVEHLFMCLSVICSFSLETCLFKSFTHFSFG